MLFNHSKKPLIVDYGDKIAQLICERIVWPTELEECEKLDVTIREDRGVKRTHANDDIYTDDSVKCAKFNGTDNKDNDDEHYGNVDDADDITKNIDVQQQLTEYCVVDDDDDDVDDVDDDDDIATDNNTKVSTDSQFFKLSNMQDALYMNLHDWPNFLNFVNGLFKDAGFEKDLYPSWILILLHFIMVNSPNLRYSTEKRESMISTILNVEFNESLPIVQTVKNTLKLYTAVDMQRVRKSTLDEEWFNTLNTIKHRGLQPFECLTPNDCAHGIGNESFITLEDLKTLFDYFINLHL